MFRVSRICRLMRLRRMSDCENLFRLSKPRSIGGQEYLLACGVKAAVLAAIRFGGHAQINWVARIILGRLGQQQPPRHERANRDDQQHGRYRDCLEAIAPFRCSLILKLKEVRVDSRKDFLARSTLTLRRFLSCFEFCHSTSIVAATDSGRYCL